MLDVTVIEDPEAAAASLDPIRARLLAELAAGPASATMLSGKVGLPRQKVNYHLKALERHGLVELAGERRKGNVTERLMAATAASYVISPLALAAVQPDPDRFRDQLSARWLLALGARLVRDVGSLITGAAKARKGLATYALDGEVRFASAADRAAFIQELTAGVTTLIRKYDAPNAEGGRDHRIVVAVHPTVKGQPVVEDQRVAKGQPVVEDQRVVKGQPVVEDHPTVKDRPAVKNQPAVKNHPTAQGHPTPELDSQ
jgi:DNA-binding transcriptional ArsR family regulator